MKNVKRITSFIALILVFTLSISFLSGCTLVKDYSLNKALENSRKAGSFSAVTQLSLELDPKIFDEILVDLDSAVFSSTPLKRIIVGSLNNPVVITVSRFAPSTAVGQVQASALFTYTELDEYGEISSSANYTVEAWLDYDFSSNENLKSDLYITIPSFDNSTTEIRSRGARYYSLDLLEHQELNKFLAALISFQANPNITVLNDTFPMDVFLGYLDNTKVEQDVYTVVLSAEQLSQSLTLLVNYVFTDDNVKTLMNIFEKDGVSDSQTSETARVKEYFLAKILKITEHLGFSQNETGTPAVSYKFTLTKKPFALFNPNAAQYISAREMEVNLNLNFRALASDFNLGDKNFTLQPKASQDDDYISDDKLAEASKEFSFKPVNIPVNSYKVKVKTSTTYVSHNTLGNEGNIGSTKKNTIDLNDKFTELYKTKTEGLKNSLLGVLKASAKDAVPVSDPENPTSAEPSVTTPPAVSYDPVTVNPLKIKSSITIAGKKAEFTSDNEPVLVNEQIMLPLRTVFDLLGGTVSFDKTSGVGVLVGKYNNYEVSLIVNSPTAIVNGSSVQMPHPVFIMNDLTFVPLRFVTDAFKLSMDFKKENDVFVIDIK